MKTIFTSLLLSLYLCSFSQNTGNAADTCLKKKLLPCKETGNQVVQIDTIGSSKFGILIDELYEKMNSSQELTIEEDRVLVLIMNTTNWAEFDNQKEVQAIYPKLSSITDFFDKAYEKALYCKYKVCTGRGFSSYFVELKVQYMGNPFACSRYFVKQ
jgi:hypothetical protein